MQIERLVDTWERVRTTTSRLEKVALLGDLLAEAGPSPAKILVAYLSGELPQGPIGLGYVTVGAVEAAPASRSTLSIADIDTAFTAIKQARGPGSKNVKSQLLSSLLAAATSPEQEFLRRLLVGALRQGALDGVMVEAVAAAAKVDTAMVRRAAMVTGDLPRVAAQALDGGADSLTAFGLQLLTAVQPMLAQSAQDVHDAIKRTGLASVEWKVDGARVQVHRDDTTVRVFTRNLRDITDSSPDVVRAAQSLEVDSIILDGEAVALGSGDRPAPFQDTMSRFASDADGSLSVVFFDCLHLNGRDLIDLDASSRWSTMQTAVPERFLINRVVTSDADVAEGFFQQAISAGYEGVMVKALDSAYESGRRGTGWIKVKPVHTLDLVVLAVEWGSGRRSGWLSNIHLGARDSTSETGFVMLGKTFKGMTDAMLGWQTERFLGLETHRDGHIVHVRPEQVVEIALDGIQRSSRYPGNVALRFARVRSYRSDKAAGDADTIETVRAVGSHKNGLAEPPNDK